MEQNNSGKKHHSHPHVAGLWLAIAALILGLCLINAVKTLKSFDNTVTVRGLCEKEVAADRVTLRISMSSQSNDLRALKSETENNEQTIVNTLLGYGLDSNEIHYTSPSYTDRYADSWGSVNNISFRYRMYQTINVVTSKTELMKHVIRNIEAEMLKHDILISTSYEYEFKGLNEIKPAMIAEALDNARQSAEEFAKNSHSKIGHMRTASQGYFSVESLDENTPQIQNVRVVTTVEYYLK